MILDKIIVHSVSWGDAWDPYKIHRREGDTALDTPDKIERMFHRWASVGIQRVQWRIPFSDETEHHVKESEHIRVWANKRENFMLE